MKGLHLFFSVLAAIEVTRSSPVAECYHDNIRKVLLLQPLCKYNVDKIHIMLTLSVQPAHQAVDQRLVKEIASTIPTYAFATIIAVVSKGFPTQRNALRPWTGIGSSKPRRRSLHI